jgi:hypothetical protein
MDPKSLSAKAPTFFVALERLMETYDIADYAVVARAVDGETRSTWIAGIGTSVVSDRERAMVLHGELGMLQASILNRYMLGPKPHADG